MEFKRKYLLILFVFHCDLGICGKSTKKRIYGGSMAEIGEFPYMVSLRRDGKHDCGGALITKKHVLTAYHCISTGYRNLIAIVGTNSLTRGGKAYRIAKVLVYPPFDGNVVKDTYDHDIAVLTLEKEVQLSHLISTISLPHSEVEDNSRGQFAGWGDDYSQQNSQFLLKLRVDTLHNNICKSYYQNYGYGYLVKNHTVCTIKEAGYGACFGDSGAPLVDGNTIVGVLSIGFDQCGIGFPDLFESVYYYLNFINYAIRH